MNDKGFNKLNEQLEKENDTSKILDIVSNFTLNLLYILFDDTAVIDNTSIKSFYESTKIKNLNLININNIIINIEDEKQLLNINELWKKVIALQKEIQKRTSSELSKLQNQIKEKKNEEESLNNLMENFGKIVDITNEEKDNKNIIKQLFWVNEDISDGKLEIFMKIILSCKDIKWIIENKDNKKTPEKDFFTDLITNFSNERKKDINTLDQYKLNENENIKTLFNNLNIVEQNQVFGLFVMLTIADWKLDNEEKKVFQMMIENMKWKLQKRSAWHMYRLLWVILERSERLKELLEETTMQKEKIEEAKESLESSINYAKRIQNSFLDSSLKKPEWIDE